MSASLVGSEMCIRDSTSARHPCEALPQFGLHCKLSAPPANSQTQAPQTCLLYTSDAADDM
eukprot:12133657-Alexandrium_andersonii.AAC.1